MMPYFLDNLLIDSSGVVSLMHRPRFTSQEDVWYSFLLEADQPQGHNMAERIRQTKKIQ
jgi:hypothetical protein